MLSKKKVLAFYLKPRTLRQCAAHFGVSMQRIHQIIRDVSPESMRKPHDKFSHLRQAPAE